jgi:phage terminase large subunit
MDDGVLYIDYEAYGVGVDIDATPQLFDTVPGAREWPITADSARPETISYMQQHGFPRMRKAKKGKGSVEDGVSFLRGFKEIVIHERCKHTADEFKMYSYKRDRLTGDILPVIEDKHNHAIDALRYAVEPVMLKNRTPQVTAVLKR